MKCHDCGRWRRVPSDAFVTARWVCADNDRDLKRYRDLGCFCSPSATVNSNRKSALLFCVSDSETHLTMNTVLILVDCVF